MIRTGITLLLSFTVTLIAAQGVGINDDGANPDPSAILDVKSTSQGVLLPRMTNQERDQIANPAMGLMIFNTETGRINYFYDNLWYELGGTVIPVQNCTWSQDFTGLTSLPSGWTSSHSSQWRVESSDEAGGTSPELRFEYSYGSDQFWVRSGLIDMSSCVNLELKFKHYVPHVFWTSVDLKVQTSIDNSNWVNRDALEVSDESFGPATWTVDLSGVDGQSFYLRFVFEGSGWIIDGWYIDDISITEN